MQHIRTQVAIIGGGPTGMLLAIVLEAAGIGCVVLERRSRAHVLSRIRAGLLEPAAVRFLRQQGLAARLDLIGRPRDGTRIAWQDRPGFMIDVKRWTGQEMMAYGQTFLTQDLYAIRERSATPYFDEISELSVEDLHEQRPSVRFLTGEGAVRLECEFVIGCDGARGQTAALIPGDLRKVFERHCPFGWLGIMVEAPPIDDFTYIHHEDGFALAAQRGPNLSRYYVQSPIDQGADAWPDDRFWQTFIKRAPPEIAAALVTGPSIEKALVPLRCRVTEPMRWGRLFLAGDSAHLMLPTGAKGLNLAISDARLLSRALIAHFATGRVDLMDSYSGDALQRVWAASNLSWRLTRLLHVFPDESPFERRLRQSDYALLLQSEEQQRALAIEYAGPMFGPDG